MEQPLLALLTLATCPSYANFGAAGFASCVRRTAHRCPTTRILHAKTHAAPASRSTAQRLAPSYVTGSARNPIARVNPAASVANRRCCRPSSLGFSAVPKAAEKVWAGGGWSGRRDSNPRPQPWQGCALPLSYARNPDRGAAFYAASPLIASITTRHPGGSLLPDRPSALDGRPWGRHGPQRQPLCLHGADRATSMPRQP
jgi:hypothetical protein